MRRLKQAIGRLTAPLRQKVHARIDAKLDAAVFAAADRAVRANQAFVPDLVHSITHSVIHQALAAYQPPTPWLDEVSQILDSLIAEQFRLQAQVEDLDRQLRDALAARVIADDDPWSMTDNR